ncbi:SGNH/GDSL hydrolase family protein [Marinobacterium sedimentorum]|uniref:SGNH/GDSL hydrolase family protein n=1 Tax=Marinobacterium sedimentorum TaxID=2927804 RepID=UPI0020C5C399|nr:SGNH/GDSL hydrolase family protein [Marinobacterium sedimentorum]MCP8689459.1 SGNH/GDSL hydrolase family protein [Marinobacterium sedimentorum]
MKTVLCFGDSNTWGHRPDGSGRYALDERWPGVMEAVLGEGFRVLVEGLGGRTTVHDDPIDGAHLNGLNYLTPCLASQKPVDLVVIMLGTNDLKHRFSVLADDIARAAGRLVERVQGSDAGPQGAAPAVLLVAPAPILEVGAVGTRFTGGRIKSQLFSTTYAAVADELGCHFLDAGNHIVSSQIDGIHLDLDAHLELGKVIAKHVREILI